MNWVNESEKQTSFILPEHVRLESSLADQGISARSLLPCCDASGIQGVIDRLNSLPFTVKPMTKAPLPPWRTVFLCETSSLQAVRLSRCFSYILGASLLSIAALSAGLPAASARPVIRVQGNIYTAPAQTITFPPVLPFGSSVYRPVQPIVQSGSGVGLSVQLGTPTYYPSGVYPSGYNTYRQRRFQQRDNRQRDRVNNSVLINPTVINGSIRNSTLVNPTIVTTPYAPAPSYPTISYPTTSYPTYPTISYPTPYYDVRTVIPTTRPEPQVVIDPQYGVRYQSPPFSSERQVIIDPQYGVRYSNPSGY